MNYDRGDEIEVVIDREGLGPDAGIGHLPDDTMVVIFGAGGMVGQPVRARVMQVAQTALGQSLLANAMT